jgi:hypothetical protein
VAWVKTGNIQGPQGPPGNDGADGATGPQGPQGPPGAAGGTIVGSDALTFPNQTAATATTITHNLGSTAYKVSIQITSPLAAAIGLWVTNKTANTFDVDAVSASRVNATYTFDWIVVPG